MPNGFTFQIVSIGPPDLQRTSYFAAVTKHMDWEFWAILKNYRKQNPSEIFSMKYSLEIFYRIL